MNWENLKEKLCPHCSGELEFDGDNEIRCTMCRFHMTPARYKSMLLHKAYRKEPSQPYKKLYWQNVKVGRCPECGDDLNDGNGKFEIIVCISPECTFKMRADTLAAMLADPLHSCHQNQL